MNFVLWPVFNYIANNRWLQITLAVVTVVGIVFLYLHLRDEKIRKQEQAKAKAIREAQIASQRKEAADRVEAFNEAARTIERLPEPELRERTKTDPNNRGLVQRD